MNETKSRILIVDDEEYVRNSLCEMLRVEGYGLRSAGSAAEALQCVAAEVPAVVVTDLRMPQVSGVELLRELRTIGCTAPVIVITGVGAVQDAVDAMKSGAFDFLQKPIMPQQLIVQIERAVVHGRLLDEVEYLRHATRGTPAGAQLVGESESMQRVRNSIRRVAAFDASVLLTGESGTGKEVAALMIHAGSGRRQKPFVTVNCAAIPALLFEGECFGHSKGAFSGAVESRRGKFEEADEGTLFLDEVGTLALDVQAKLLRFLESGEYHRLGETKTRRADVRVVAATNDDLSRRVKGGDFRADLYFRLNVFPIELPALRHHLTDIEAIASELFARSAGPHPLSAAPLSAEAIRVLEGYRWPGNVRELRNVLERAVISGGAWPPDPGLLRDILESSLRTSRRGSAIGEGTGLRDHLTVVERDYIVEALASFPGKKEAAEFLGIDPRNLAYYLRKHGLRSAGEGGVE